MCSDEFQPWIQGDSSSLLLFVKKLNLGICLKNIFENYTLNFNVKCLGALVSDLPQICDFDNDHLMAV
jgi:hypothetical protein